MSRSKYSEEEIAESFEKALEEGTLQDVMGNTITSNDLIEVDMETSTEAEVRTKRVIEGLKHLQGKVLTVVDATYQDKEQAKYVKDIIKDAFATQGNWFFELLIVEEQREESN